MESINLEQQQETNKLLDAYANNSTQPQQEVQVQQEVQPQQEIKQ